MKLHESKNKGEIHQIESLLESLPMVSIKGDRKWKVRYREPFAAAKINTRIVMANSKDDAEEAVRMEVGECRIVKTEEKP